jgi:hypothetical protein
MKSTEDAITWDPDMKSGMMRINTVSSHLQVVDRIFNMLMHSLGPKVISNQRVMYNGKKNNLLRG